MLLLQIRFIRINATSLPLSVQVLPKNSGHPFHLPWPQVVRQLLRQLQIRMKINLPCYGKAPTSVKMNLEPPPTLASTDSRPTVAIGMNIQIVMKSGQRNNEHS